MGSVGDSFDNAMAESVFATIETELLWHHTFVDINDARSHFIDFVEGWYNTTRRHTSIGNISPMRLEHDHANSYTQSQLYLSRFPRQLHSSVLTLASAMARVLRGLDTTTRAT